jgi:DNA anti-recombination protein RmuC
MSDPGISDRPELTRSDYDRLIALLRASQAKEEKDSTTTCRELDKELHGISVRLDQMQEAIHGRFDQMQQATNDRFDQMQQANNDRLDVMQQANNTRFDVMQRVFIGAAFLTIACIGYLFVATTQTVALGRVESRFDTVDKGFVAVGERFDAMDKRFDGIERRLDVMDERIDKRFEGIDRRLDNIVGQLRPTKQQGLVDKQ